MKHLFNILTLLFLVSFISCNTNEESEELNLDEQNLSKIYTPDDTFVNNEMIVAIYFRTVFTEQQKIRIRNRFFANCNNPITLGCSSNLSVEMHNELPGHPTNEYWIIKKCNPSLNIECPGQIKDDIDNDGDISSAD